MVVAHLLFIVMAGFVGATASLLMGASGWSVVGGYVIGTNLGLVASLMCAALELRRPRLDHRSEPGRAG